MDTDAASPLVVVSHSPERTRQIGVLLGRRARIGDVILLHGDLGAGKTTITQGIGEGLQVSDPVRSPTFTLVAEHDGQTPTGDPIRLYHLDLYRLTGAADLDSFGFDTYLAPTDGITVIEWPERAGATLPQAYLLIELEAIEEEGRRLTIGAVPTGPETVHRMDALRQGLLGLGFAEAASLHTEADGGV
jgi:tRNA threonylcarbamoyladenosine biosynthesis protein TsaE